MQIDVGDDGTHALGLSPLVAAAGGRRPAATRALVEWVHDRQAARPTPQATVSGWFILVGSVFIVLLAFQQVATLGSLEAQQSAEELSRRRPDSGLGLSVDDVQSILRADELRRCRVRHGDRDPRAGTSCSRSRSSRLALSVLAPVLLVAGIVPAGFAAALVAAAVAMLWVQPTRSWFDGVEPPAAAPRSGAVGAPPPSASYPPPQPSAAETPAVPPPPSGAPAPSSWTLPAPGAPTGPPQPGSAQPGPRARPAAAVGRPSQVTTACVVALASTAVALAGVAVSLLLLLTSRDSLVAEIDKELTSASYDAFTADTLASVMLVFFAVLLVWGVVAVFLAVATMRRSNTARIALIVSSLLSALVSLLGVLVVVPLLFTVAAIVTTVLLLSPASRAWFAAGSGS